MGKLKSGKIRIIESNLDNYKSVMKLFIHFQAPPVQPLMFMDMYIISSHTLPGMWLLIHDGNKVNKAPVGFGIVRCKTIPKVIWCRIKNSGKRREWHFHLIQKIIICVLSFDAMSSFSILSDTKSSLNMANKFSRDLFVRHFRDYIKCINVYCIAIKKIQYSCLSYFETIFLWGKLDR